MGDVADNSVKGGDDARRFAAFISYSHADAAAAANLHRKLERYRLPRRIAEMRDKGASLGTMFRDREDLAAAASLSAAIRDAIAHAEALIVLCSPDAATSPWVTAEIEMFRSVHPEKPILAVLLSGDPSASFPPALTAGGLEPLAADLRSEGDGPQLGFLKIVAGIAGVRLDALIQRDAQRRIRRVTAITLGALAAMLVMGVMTIFAVSARNEATRQRAASDGLVEYMLTDLREILKGVGRPEAMASVNERAMSHYRQQGSLSALTDDGLERRTRVLLAMGEDDEKYGRLDKAVLKFREAHRTTAALLARAPANPDRLFAHAQSEYWVGRGALAKSDAPTALVRWRAYRALAGKLAAVEPDSLRSLMELGYSEGNLCDLASRDAADLATAINHCQNAVGYVGLAHRKFPQDRKTMQDLANRHGWLARITLEHGQQDIALKHRRAEARLMDKLIALDPRNIEYILRRSWPDLGMAAVYLEKGNNHEAQALISASLRKYDESFRAFGDDARIAETHLRFLLHRAKARKNMGQDFSADIAAANAVALAFPDRENMRRTNRILQAYILKGRDIS